MRRRAWMLWGGLALTLGSVNALVLHKEHVVAAGTKIYVELAPTDPRSILQGDYMQLDYAAAAALSQLSGVPAGGHIVVRLDERGVATFVRLKQKGEVLAPHEHLLRFKTREQRVQLGSGAFFFQEGHGKYYEHAKYGELRVAASGTSVLVGLCDERLQRITPPARVLNPLVR